MSITLPPLPESPEATITITKDQLLAYGQQTAMVAIAVDRASRVPMTKEQMAEIWFKWFHDPDFLRESLIRAVEAHHGIGAKP